MSLTELLLPFFVFVFFLLFLIGGSEVYSILLTLFTGQTLAHDTHINLESPFLNAITIIIITKLESQSMQRKYQ